MRTNSFRVKVALLSGFLSAGILVIAGVVLWELTYRRDLDRLDRELRHLGAPHLDRVNGGEHWTRFEDALSFVAGTNQGPSFILWVAEGRRRLHRSANWPASLDPESVAALERYEPPYEAIAGRPPPPPPRRSEPISRNNPPLPRKEPAFFTHEADGHRWRVAVLGNPYLTLLLGADLEGLHADMRQLRNAWLAALPIVLLAVVAGSWLLASRAIRPVTILTQAAEQVSADDLSQRIAAPGHDREFVRLISVFNAMLDRLETGFLQAKRFSADAAHELRTPLTILQIDLEQSMNAAPPGSDHQRLCSRLIDEISHLRAITEKLLLLAQADAGKLPLQPVPTSLSDLVAESIEDARVLGPTLRIESNLQPGILVEADPHLLPQVIQNLIANAVKYNEPGGRIHLSLGTTDNRACLTVANTGPGIPAEQRPRVFDRFHRVDPSRTSGSGAGGTGLGLSLSREIARAHGGELELSEASAGLTAFTLTLPLHNRLVTSAPKVVS